MTDPTSTPERTNEGIGEGMKIANKSSVDAFEILNANGQLPCMLVCDHATSNLPASYDNLGLPDATLREHIALDIGIEPVVREQEMTEAQRWLGKSEQPG